MVGRWVGALKSSDAASKMFAPAQCKRRQSRECSWSKGLGLSKGLESILVCTEGKACNKRWLQGSLGGLWLSAG